MDREGHWVLPVGIARHSQYWDVSAQQAMYRTNAKAVCIASSVISYLFELCCNDLGNKTAIELY